MRPQKGDARMATVTLSGIGKDYGAVNVIRNLNLEIEDGEFVVLLGPSGCGKSTLLRMICGLESITTGELQIDGKRVNDMAPMDRNIAMVFQSYALYPNLTAAKNMAFSMEMRGANRDEIRTKVDEAARLLGLEEYLDRLPRHLSGGQRQRVAMGRAIVRDPKVFLFDEPLSNLDAKMRVQMRSEIKTLHQKLGTTTIYVTHDQIEAMTMADKVVLLHDGNIEQVGPALELYDRPANEFVAGFIGSPAMNFLKGSYDAEDHSFATNRNDRVPLDNYVAPQESRDILLGIRPEHLEIVESDQGHLAATVGLVEPTGSETQIVLRYHDLTLDLLSRDRVALKAGDRVSLKIPSHRVHLFDRTTGERITNEG